MLYFAQNVCYSVTRAYGLFSAFYYSTSTERKINVMGSNEAILQRVEEIVDSYDCKREKLIAILQDIQQEYKYLSPEALELIADKLGIGVAKVYSVATFYENFSLEAKGKYIIKVCTGTACHVRKSQPIYDALHEHLGLKGKQKTSDDGLFTLETVACLGACGLSPVMTINDEVHPKMTPDAALALIEEIRAKEAANK